MLVISYDKVRLMRFVFALLALVLPVSAFGQALPTGTKLNSPVITGTISGGPNASAATVTVTGGTTARTLAAQAADVANVKNYGATGSGSRQSVFYVSTTASNPVASINAGITAANIGNYIAIQGVGSAGATLATTITSVSGNNITLANAPSTTVTNANEYVAFGTDASVGINAAVASGANEIDLPTGTYTIANPIFLTAEHRVSVNCKGSTIVAVASMDAMIDMAAGSDFYATEGTTFSGCRIDGMGLANKNIHHNRFSWQYHDLSLLNALVENILCDGYCENTYFTAISAYNLISTPTYIVNVGYTDNHFTDFVASGASAADFYDNSSGTYWTNVHGYGINAGPVFLLSGAATNATNIYADTVASGQSGINITGNYVNVNGWRATISGSWVNQIGVQISNSSSGVNVTGGDAQNFDQDHVVVQVGAGTGSGGSNSVFSNNNSAYTSDGNQAAATCLGLQVRCNGSRAVAIGAYAQANYGNIAVGNTANSYGQNTSAAMGASVTANGNSSWVRGYGTNDNLMYGVDMYTGTGTSSAEIGRAVLYANVTTTSVTRLTTDTNAAGAYNSLIVPASGSLSMECAMTVHSTSSQDAAYFYMTDANAALYTKGASGAPTLVGGSWSAGSASAGATGKLTPAVSVDATNNTPSISITATSGTWHAVAKCDFTIAN